MLSAEMFVFNSWGMSYYRKLYLLKFWWNLAKMLEPGAHLPENLECSREGEAEEHLIKRDLGGTKRASIKGNLLVFSISEGWFEDFPDVRGDPGSEEPAENFEKLSRFRSKLELFPSKSWFNYNFKYKGCHAFTPYISLKDPSRLLKDQASAPLPYFRPRERHHTLLLLLLLLPKTLMSFRLSCRLEEKRRMSLRTMATLPWKNMNYEGNSGILLSLYFSENFVWIRSKLSKTMSGKRNLIRRSSSAWIYIVDEKAFSQSTTCNRSWSYELVSLF